MTLRDKIIDKVADYEYDGMEHNQEEIIAQYILSLIRKAVEEAKPKEKECKDYNGKKHDTFDIGGSLLHADETGYNQALKDYHEALIKKLQ